MQEICHRFDENYRCRLNCEGHDNDDEWHETHKCCLNCAEPILGNVDCNIEGLCLYIKKIKEQKRTCEYIRIDIVVGEVING